MFTDNEVTQIIEYYEGGKSTYAIGKLLGRPHSTIYGMLKRKGIEMREYTYNDAVHEDFFSVIDSPAKAYILGLWFSDGNVKHDTRHAAALFMVDKDIIEKVIPLLYEEPIEPILKKTKTRDQFGIVIRHKNICHDLIKQGCVPKKSLVLGWPPNLPDYLISHFLRGLTDGDGCFSYSKSIKYNTYAFTWSLTSGSSDFCREASRTMERVLGVQTTFHKKLQKGKNPYYTISISKRRDLIKLIDFLYKDSHGLYMDRKYEKSCEMLHLMRSDEYSPDYEQCEDDYILENYGKSSLKIISLALKRDMKSIIRRAYKLGLDKKKFYPHDCFWSEEADVFILENYEKLSRLEIATHLERTPCSIDNRMKQLRGKGSIDSKYNVPWTECETKFVLDNWGILSCEQIANELGRTKRSVESRWYGKRDVSNVEA